MAEAFQVILTLKLIDSELDEEALDEETRRLLRELRDHEDIDEAELVSKAQAPEGTKAIGGFVLGALKAAFSMAHIKSVLAYLQDRLGNKPIELTVEAKGRKLTVKANSRQELEAAIEAAERFICST